MSKKSVKPADDRPFYDVEVVDIDLFINAINNRILPSSCVKVDIAFLRNQVRMLTLPTIELWKTCGLKITEREKRDA